MQLVIPIEDTSSGTKGSNHCVEQQQELESASGRWEPRNNGAILSKDLRDQFETMQSVWRQARRDGEDVDSSSSNNSNRERVGNMRSELKRKERETAVETAIKVDREIAFWQEGIADLEALLAAEDEQVTNEEGASAANNQHAVEENGPPGIREISFVRRNHLQAPVRPAQIQFPFLPPAIPTEEESD